MKLGLRPVEVSSGGETVHCPSPGEELRPGDVLDDRFAITEMISRGGMATIYKALDLHGSHEPVVLKVPHKTVEFDQNLFERFLREEAIGLRLDHPSVLKVLPVHETKSRPYMVMEYLRGCTLLHLIRNFRLFPESDALAITG